MVGVKLDQAREIAVCMAILQRVKIVAAWVPFTSVKCSD